MTYCKQNINKERQAPLFDANRVTITLGIRKHEAPKQTQALKEQKP